MYLKRFLVATAIGFMWYFSDYGEVTLQLGVFICVLLSFKLFKRSVECSTQTDDLAENSPNQEINEEKICSSDGSSMISTKEESSHGLQYVNVKRSLQKVFECAYEQTFVPWYNVPEAITSQPLHGALKTEFDLFVDRLISRARGFDLCAASVGCIRILSQHLHNAKQSKEAPLFSSRAEEMRVLRVFSEALVRNLLPETLWDLELYRCILNEVVAVKVLDLLVTWLSDPDNLNQLIVSQLDGVAVGRSVEDLRASERENGASSSESEDAGASADDAEDISRKRNKPGKKLKEGWSKFLEKMKSKKAKKKEQELIYKALERQSSASPEDYCNAVSNNEGSVRSETDSESEISDFETYLTSVQEDMMEFKLSYEMWRVGNWNVTVKNVQRESEELCFTVHLEERDNPENLHWDVMKTQTDLLFFHSRWQDMSGLPSVSAIVDDKGRDLDEAFQEETKTTLQTFLQELVSDSQFGHSQPVFQFLCPLDKLLSEEQPCGGVWGLVSGIAYFLTPSYEEEEHFSPVAEANTEDVKTTVIMNKLEVVKNEVEHTEGDTKEPHHTSLKSMCPTNASNTDQIEEIEPTRADDGTSEGLEDDCDQPGAIISGLSSITESFDEFLAKAKSVIPKVHHTIINQNSDSLVLNDSWSHLGNKTSKRDNILHKMSAGRHKSKEKDQGCIAKEDSHTQSHLEKNTNQSWEHLEATKAIFDLLKEISGNSFILNIFDAILKPVMPLVKKKVNSFLDRMNPTEAQVASCIDTAREKQWPEGPQTSMDSRPQRTQEEKSGTRERAQQLINTKYSKYLILKKTDVETVFKIFQEAEENRKLAYMLLSFLLHEFLPGEPALNVIAQLYVKDVI
ncbi:uncharacterized protein si:rp71-46j2.7 isoform X1 [Alosa sapidissima]|uniref:uncharacterized protein si:rp71-46j2.7 isoform X1 n=1 Tax=Alosa sapidissima TaxID=34773 RepID=UPI001C0833EA|nr:uncharacterized protein si:rp71-46j2.7 isoform X1 [Alosa sapidissima]